MATVDVVSLDNKKQGSLELRPDVFQAAVRPHLFHAEVTRQMAARRSGTHSTKNRSAVSGGGAKPWRQKGTGRARQGSSRSPQWQGGGVVFGPVPRSHGHKLNKKTRREALRSAISERFGKGDVTVVEDFEIAEYKTRLVVEALESLGLAGKSVLIVIDASHPQLEGSARNLPRVNALQAGGLNVYDVLRHSHLVLTRAAVAVVEARLAREEVTA